MVGGLEAGVVGVAGGGGVTAGVVEEEYIQCASFIKKGTAATAMLAMVISFMTVLPLFYSYTHIRLTCTGKKKIKWRERG